MTGSTRAGPSPWHCCALPAAPPARTLRPVTPATPATSPARLPRTAAPTTQPARMQRSGRPNSASLLGNWIESRLWQRFPAAQRDFLLDAGLMDELDPVLLDEALECNDSRHRLQSMTELDGLLHPFPGTGDRRRRAGAAPAAAPALCGAAQPGVARTLQEHPPPGRRGAGTARRYVRARCAMPRKQATRRCWAGSWRTPAASAACGRAHVQPALRQAMASLTHDAVKAAAEAGACPGLGILAISDRIPEARRLYELAAQSSGGFTHNPAGGVRDLRIDQAIIKTAFFTSSAARTLTMHSSSQPPPTPASLSRTTTWTRTRAYVPGFRAVSP